MADEQENKTLPVELQLDLLVDAELPEGDRQALLLAMDREPTRWRELAIRFLERQAERQSIREFVGEVAAPAKPVVEKETPYRFPWTGRGRVPQALAAGLMIATISGVIVLVAGRDKGPAPVPVTVASDREQSFFPAQDAGEASRPSNRSVVIQPDGNGNAVVIPVNTLPMKFY